MWCPQASSTSLPPAGPHVLAGSGSNDRLRRALIAGIAHASREIWLCSPMIDDQEVTEALVAARGRRVRVKVLSEVRTRRGGSLSTIARGFLEGGAGHPGRHEDERRRLALGGVRLRSPPAYCHAKAWVFDELLAFVGSANVTPNALHVGDRPSIEAGVLFRRPDAVALVREQLAMLWQGCALKQQQSEGEIFIAEDPAPVLDGSLFDRTLADGTSFSWQLPFMESHSVRQRLITNLSSAERSIKLLALSFYETNSIPGLHSALLAALRRGVDVLTVVRPPDRQHGGAFPDPDTLELIDAGMRLEGLSGLHAKGACVDGSWALAFTGNFNRYSLDGMSETDHVEFGVSGPTSVPEIAAWARWLAGVTGDFVWGAA